MNIQTETQDRFLVVRLEGDVDAYSSSKIKDELLGLIDRGSSSMVVDVSKVPYMDSSGLGMLVTVLKNINKKHGVLRLTGLNEDLRNIFRLTRLDKVFQIYETVPEALKFHD